MAYFGYLMLRLVAGLFWLVPFRLLYLKSDFLLFLLYRVVGYRKKVIQGNLKKAFPEISDEELARLTRETYRNLSDITLETIKGFTTPLPELYRRCEWVNIEKLNAYLEAGQSVIVAGAHYNSWEYPCFTGPHLINGRAYTAYKPLSNPYIDAYYSKARVRDNALVMSMDETAKVIRGNHNKHASAYFLVADQSPTKVKSAHWVDFLGIDTAFIPGPDMLARRYGYPVLFMHVKRVGRGYYQVVLEDVCPDPSGLGAEEVTRLYANHLEQVIRTAPENWLWSHKRWKRQRK
jgi:KDO2-lipid IV(A) lauroyltransferase